jgi:hypothetical protein
VVCLAAKLRLSALGKVGADASWVTLVECTNIDHAVKAGGIPWLLRGWNPARSFLDGTGNTRSGDAKRPHATTVALMWLSLREHHKKGREKTEPVRGHKRPQSSEPSFEHRERSAPVYFTARCYPRT